MSLQGKGFWIWKVNNSEGGSPSAIAAQALTSGFTHVTIKIADGTYSYNYDSARALDLVPPVVQALRGAGMQVWGWHYVYGYDPLGEARKAIQRLQQLNLDGYIIDAEKEYKEPGKNIAAQKFMTEMRAAFPSLPMAISSYRFPSYHPSFPWKDFLAKVDINMPQVYWEASHNPATQLGKCLSEFQALTPYRPVYPTGPTYKAGGWAPTESDITQFLDSARANNLPAVNFFSWEECRRDLPNLWTLIGNYPWSGGAPGGNDLPNQFMAALNRHDIEALLSLYNPNAVHITSARTVQGIEPIRNWYNTLFTQTIPNATFTMTGVTGTPTSRHISWQATNNRSTIQNGADTLGIIDGKINYHYTFFTVNPG